MCGANRTLICIMLIDMNIHLDTPTEILHTVLLGVIKYFWGQMVHILEKAKLLNLFQSHLESINNDSLNAPSLNAEYMCHYKGGLIRKHFKSLAQVMPFVIYYLVPQTVVDGWTTIGELVVLLWHTKINDLNVDLVSARAVMQSMPQRPVDQSTPYLGTPQSNHQRFLKCNSALRTKYSHFQAEIPFSCSSSSLYSAFQTSHHFLN